MAQAQLKHVNLIQSSNTVNFADVAHQTLIFDLENEAERLVLELVDTPWVQRLRHISQTGNTRLVYMFSEHSRFGHSLGVAFLASLLMKSLRKHSRESVARWEKTVLAAALLHDIGHVAPGSHLGEKLWARKKAGAHEKISIRAIQEDQSLREILNRYENNLTQKVVAVLSEDESVPPWTRSIISGGGWNADRGNWTIVDSAMCAVTYGRYNVTALIDAFRISDCEQLVISESRIDALTHFFMARDSMYRQIYQHRVLQAVDELSKNIVRRLRFLVDKASDQSSPLSEQDIFADQIMMAVLKSKNYGEDLPLETVFNMTESWWQYHINRWCKCKDPILRDLSERLRDRKLFKTISLGHKVKNLEEHPLVLQAREIASKLGYDPEYYTAIIEEKDKHRAKLEEAPMVLLDSGEIHPVNTVEPMINQIMKRPTLKRAWLTVPQEIKEKLGRIR